LLSYNFNRKSTFKMHWSQAWTTFYLLTWVNGQTSTQNGPPILNDRGVSFQYGGGVAPTQQAIVPQSPAAVVTGAPQPQNSAAPLDSSIVAPPVTSATEDGDIPPAASSNAFDPLQSLLPLNPNEPCTTGSNVGQFLFAGTVNFVSKISFIRVS
jgi:hypothetical protein